MKRCVKTFFRLVRDERGATTIEYVMIAALISVAAIISMREVGSNVSKMYGVADKAMSDAVK